ncbi:hypothetical protein SDC9_101038 [bioreactor metagenome]|uniref:Uncharacterized protein n=1 Tax=bioreactor metagenome TaxID=1076179 RepID=A0A645ALY9_9ZZZZ
MNHSIFTYGSFSKPLNPYLFEFMVIIMSIKLNEIWFYDKITKINRFEMKILMLFNTIGFISDLFNYLSFNIAM